MKKTKNQILIICFLTIFSSLLTYLKFNDDKIIYRVKFTIPLEFSNTYYQYYLHLYKNEVKKMIESNQNTKVEIQKDGVFFIRATKKQIIDEIEFVKSGMHKINEKNFNLSRIDYQSRENLIIDLLKNYQKDTIVTNSKGEEISIISSLERFIKKNHNTLNDTYEYNKKIIDNFSVQNLNLSSKAKNKFEIINSIVILGVIFSLISFLFNIRRT